MAAVEYRPVGPRTGRCGHDTVDEIEVSTRNGKTTRLFLCMYAEDELPLSPPWGFGCLTPILPDDEQCEEQKLRRWMRTIANFRDPKVPEP